MGNPSRRSRKNIVNRGHYVPPVTPKVSARTSFGPIINNFTDVDSNSYVFLSRTGHNKYSVRAVKKYKKTKCLFNFEHPVQLKPNSVSFLRMIFIRLYICSCICINMNNKKPKSITLCAFS